VKLWEKRVVPPPPPPSSSRGCHSLLPPLRGSSDPPEKKCASKTFIFQSKMVKFFTTMEVLHLAVIFAVLFRVNGELIVDAEAEVSIRLNDEADLTCTTSGNRIAVCTFISPNRESFTRTPGLKYPRVTYMTDDPDNSCSMKIGSVKEEDNGEWKCDITTVDDAGNALQGSNLIALTVLKPPRSVSLNVDSSVAVTPEDPKKQIRCTAEGGHPAPTFSWLLGGAPAKVEVLDTITEGTDGFYQEVSYTAKKEDDGKTLECVANSQAYTEEDLAAEINKAKTVLDVQYKPVPAKEEYVFYGLTVGQPFPIRISFRSNPTPTDMRWKMHDGVEVPQGSEDQDGKYTSALPEPGPVDGEDSLYTAMLTINNVVAEDAGTTNTLVMTNQHGTAEIKFKLTLGEKPPTGADLVTDEKAGENSNEDEAGTGPVIAVVIIILIIIIVIAVAVVARAQGLLCFAESQDREYLA